MKSINNKFENLIRKLNYDLVKFTALDVAKLETFYRTQMPGVVEELVEQKWDLSNDDTWLTNVFCDHVLDWYGNKVSVFLTNSWQEYNLFKRVINFPKFQLFREQFGINMQVCLLTHNVIFMRVEDLDTIYLNFDFDKGYCALDISGFDAEDNPLSSEWDYLVAEGGQLGTENWENTGDEWSVEEVAKAYKQKVYKYDITD